jgi:hypothetical protein
MSVAEAEARANGCKYAGLSTFEFQARPFYERLGYECFGVLNDHPLGHTHYYMSEAPDMKPLVRAFISHPTETQATIEDIRCGSSCCKFTST